MDTSLVKSETVELLSRIAGQKLNQEDVSPSLVFMASLVTLMLGVIHADGTVAEQEEKLLEETIARLFPPENDLYPLAVMLKNSAHVHLASIDDLVGLTNPLSESEKLLLISFGYQMSTADGNIDISEKKYLDQIGTLLLLDPRYQVVIEAAFSDKKTADNEALEKVQSLLDPGRFQSLEPLFVNAANHILEDLLAIREYQISNEHSRISYNELQNWKETRKNLDSACHRLFEIIQEDVQYDRHIFNDPLTLRKEISKISQKIQSLTFRVAVVGEFSKGKSTLLNALLGENIQPVRVIPTNGTVTILKYGKQRRVVCRYKNGREEEIPFEQYREKASISKEAAINHRSDELARCEIEEIIYEHPGLELCKNGIELIDSPGLNEHPERTLITIKLVQDADVIIFMLSALNILTYGERELIKDLRIKLNGGNPDRPAKNLFLVVNFMDQLDNDEDREDVEQVVKALSQGHNPIITGENRIHFISAKAALKAILGGYDDNYLQDFRYFIKSIENFLTTERGSFKIQQPVTKIRQLIECCLSELNQTENFIDGEVNLFEIEKQKILEQIGEASGRDVIIRRLVDQLASEVIEQASNCFDDWYKELRTQITEKSKSWTSTHNPVFSQNKLIGNYINQFTQDLYDEINRIGNEKVRRGILQAKLSLLDKKIDEEFKKILLTTDKFDKKAKTNFSDQLNIFINSINANFAGAGGVIGGIGVGGGFAAGLALIVGVGLAPVILAGAVATIAAAVGLGMLDIDGLKKKIKETVLQEGFKQFDKSINQISENFYKIVNSSFETRVEAASAVISKQISIYENLLYQKEKAYKETQQQRDAEKAFIAQKRQELEQIQKNIEAILAQVAR